MSTHIPPSLLYILLLTSVFCHMLLTTRHTFTQGDGKTQGRVCERRRGRVSEPSAGSVPDVHLRLEGGGSRDCYIDQPVGEILQ